MKREIIFKLLFFLLSINVFAQNYFPGGVAGAEAWFIVNHEQLDTYINHSNSEIKILKCAGIGNRNKSFFNFNPSFKSEQICLFYNAALEITTARNIFFVGEPKENRPNYSHVTTNWNNILGNLSQTDSLIKNRFDLATKETYFNKRLVTYGAANSASISFYHWNMYQTDKKFKSYGAQGESTFYVGKFFSNELTDGQSYAGNFPEFISFPFELSANERNRVESYLALKYGITLNSPISYKNSKNTVFWNNKNNSFFGNRIFGIGRDDISGLNQLQSESSHDKDYLISAVLPVSENNVIKQQTVNIPNNHFLVFGDNGAADGLKNENAVHVRILNRKWLSQNTGTTTSGFPMHFNLKLQGALKLALEMYPSLNIWMLHDKYVSNNEVSDFTSQYVEYYRSSLSLSGIYHIFSRIHFDADKSIYDQYTFGIGPDMILQVRFDPNCTNKDLKAKIIVNGGTPPFEVQITSSSGLIESFGMSEHTKTFNVNSSESYTVRVIDNLGYQQEVTIDVMSPQMDIDLGPDQILSANLQQITLNAGQNVNDPGAIYKWYRNEELLEHFDPILVVDKPGEYTVKVMSKNRMCEKSDTILINYQFLGNATQILDCEIPVGVIALTLEGGIPPYTTVITGIGQTVYQVHDTESFLFSDIDFGLRTVTTTDSNGEIFQTDVMVNDLGGMELNLTAQLQQNCTDYGYNYSSSYPTFSCNDIILNAGALVTNPNVTYEWFMNGNSMQIYSPIVLTISDQDAFPINTNGYNEFQVKVRNLDTGCEVTEFFGMTKYGGIKGVDKSFATRIKEDIEIENNIENEALKAITSKVYPNPSESGATFYYEVSSGEVFTGTIEIFSPTGAILLQETISGQSSYKLPFTLSTAGVYFICTKTNGILLTDKIIIK